MTVRLAVIPGDGVGPEVVAATVPVLDRALALTGGSLQVTELDWGGERYLREGAAMPTNAADIVRAHDAALFGAVGRPDVPDDALVFGRARQEVKEGRGAAIKAALVARKAAAKPAG